jgi:hypothetical protein
MMKANKYNIDKKQLEIKVNYKNIAMIMNKMNHPLIFQEKVLIRKRKMKLMSNLKGKIIKILIKLRSLQ